eukprot:scaffold9834_cov105-Isochrysis_galbana.AAC.11
MAPMHGVRLGATNRGRPPAPPPRDAVVCLWQHSNASFASRLLIGDEGFRALSQQLWGTEAHHLAVRAAAVRTIHCGRNGFFGAIFESADWLDEYVAEMAQPRTWGDEITIRATVR